MNMLYEGLKENATIVLVPSIGARDDAARRHGRTDRAGQAIGSAGARRSPGGAARALNGYALR